jgi:hypothetical protein
VRLFLWPRGGAPWWFALSRFLFGVSMRARRARADLTMPVSEKLIVEHYSR